MTSVLGVTEQHARVLLMWHRWDVERLMASYAEDAEACFRRAGLATGDEAAGGAEGALRPPARPPAAR